MITKIISADEAAKITSETIERDSIAQLEAINTAIIKAASNGKFEVDWQEYLSERVREYLQNQGYNLQDWRDCFNNEYITINWRN